MRPCRAAIAGIGVAHPPPVRQSDLWEKYFASHYAGVAESLAKRIFANSGVDTRHGAVNPLVEDVSGWSTGARMLRYLPEALSLGRQAIDSALRQAGVAAADVGMLVACSCTGYVTPGLDILLARDLGLPLDSRRVFVGHMGCYAALPGLGVAADYVASHGRPAILLCVEVTSLHVQPAASDPQQVVTHALFSDAAAAVVLVPDGGGPAVVEIGCRTDYATADHMTWKVTDLGFRMGLSPQVPEVLAHHVGPLVSELATRQGWAVSEIGDWAIHPGGPRILDVVADQLDLGGAEMAPSRTCLAAHGNCSSPTVLMILDQILRTRAGGTGPIALLAFGPGLTLYGALLLG